MMRLLSLNMLMLVSSFSVTGGVLNVDNSQYDPPEKNNVAIVVSAPNEPEGLLDIFQKVESTSEEADQAWDSLQAIVDAGEKKRLELENLRKKQEAEKQQQQKESTVVASVSAPAVSTTPTVSAQNATEGAGQTYTPAATVTQSSSSSTSGYQAMTIYAAGVVIPYQNGGQGSGQAIIDSNPYGTASTWGGAPVQSGTDGLSTHFIGHNPGIFASLFQLGTGHSVTITDGSGTPTVYTVTNVYQVDDYAVEVGTGRELWSTITGSGNGEQVVFQVCINDHLNQIIVAVK